MNCFLLQKKLIGMRGQVFAFLIMVFSSIFFLVYSNFIEFIFSLVCIFSSIFVLFRCDIVNSSDLLYISSNIFVKVHSFEFCFCSLLFSAVICNCINRQIICFHYSKQKLIFRAFIKKITIGKLCFNCL